MHAMPIYTEGEMLHMGTRVVTISVGIKPNHEDFTVHEKLIRDTSTLIDASLKDDKREHPQRMILLTEFQPKDFMIYIQWLYSERVFMEFEGDDGIMNQGRRLIKGYLLGHHLGDIKYRDILMDCLLRWGNESSRVCKTLISEEAVAVFNGTEFNDPLRKFIADFTVRNTDYDFWFENYQKFPEDLVAMVSLGHAYRCYKGGDEPFERAYANACLYHCHGNETCYRDSPGWQRAIETWWHRDFPDPRPRKPSKRKRITSSESAGSEPADMIQEGISFEEFAV